MASITASLVVAFAIALAPAGPARAQQAVEPVYTTLLLWDDWSWGVDIDPSSEAMAYTGDTSMAVTYERAWAGVSFRRAPMDTDGYTHLEFALHPASGSAPPNLSIGLFDVNDDLMTAVPLAPYVTPASGGWLLASVPLEALGASDTTITRMMIQAAGGSFPPTLYLDDIQFVWNDLPTGPPTAPLYEDALFWDDWSWWSDNNPFVTSPVHSGAHSLGVTFSSPWAGLSVHSDGTDASPYTHIDVAINGGPDGPPTLRLAVHDGSGALAGTTPLTPYLTSGSGDWYTASVPLRDVGADGIEVSRITLQESAGRVPPTFYVDSFKLSSHGDDPPPTPGSLPIVEGDTWQYRLGLSEPPADWASLGFDASGWESGPSGFGFSDGDDATQLSGMRGVFSSVYLRKTFEVPDAEAISRLVLNVDYDDGFVAYLNGVEVARANMAGGRPGHDAVATHAHEASGGDENPQPAGSFDISAHLGLLQDGENVLAIQGHNVHLWSSDFSLIPGLTTTVTPPSQTAPSLPILEGDAWSYMKGTSAPPEDWTEVSFDDSSWPTGSSGFGYGDGDDATVLGDMDGNYLSLFIRREFHVDDPALVGQLLLSIDYDDGFIAYLNGVEVARSGMVDGEVTYTTPAKGFHEASGGGGTPQVVEVHEIAGNLRAGTNVIAIQGHNAGLSGPDFSLIPMVEANVAEPGSVRFTVRPGMQWRFARGIEAPPSGWNDLGFNDSSWSYGPSGFGYADGDDGTTLWNMAGGYTSVYARKTFTVADPSDIDALFLTMDFDDGFVAYINGVEVARDNVNGNPPAFDATAAESREAANGGPDEPFMPGHFDISGMTDLLVEGENVLAVQGHNSDINSYDFSLIPGLLGASGVDLDPVLVRYPSLEAPDQDALTVVFSTKISGVPTVSFGKAGTGMPNTVSGTTEYYSRLSGYYQHAVRLTGLAAGTTYEYSIALDGKPIDVGLPLTFDSAPAPGDPLEVVMFGDSGTGTFRQLQIRDLMMEDSFDLILHTGDVSEVNGSYRDYHRYVYDVYRDLVKSAPFVPTMGNGDWWAVPPDQENGEAFTNMFELPVNAPPGALYFSFDYGNVHFVGLDTENVSTEQWEWLENDLATADAEWLVVIFHRAPFDDGSDHPMAETAGIRAAFVPLFEEHGVDIVFNGHNAAYGRTVPLTNGRAAAPYADITTIEEGGIVYITTGGGGDFSLDTIKEDEFHAPPGIAVSSYHYSKMTIDGCVLTVEAKHADGTLIETYTMDKCPS